MLYKISCIAAGAASFIINNNLFLLNKHFRGGVRREMLKGGSFAGDFRSEIKMCENAGGEERNRRRLYKV